MRTSPARLSARLIQKLVDKICEIFHDYDLKIVIDANHKVINFLDITMNLETGVYQPYMKPNNTIKYINTKSNHPPCILANNPENINKRISRNSANEMVFKGAIEPYQKALDENNYKFQLKFDPNARNVTNRNKRNRNRRITWFNPPFSLNVKTKVGASFFQIIKECIPQNHPLYRICNKNTIKLSYRTTNNMQSFISKHNRSILQKHLQEQHPERSFKIRCNCQANNKPKCGLPGRCTITNLVYRATITRHDTNASSTQTGCTVEFKQRHKQHLESFEDPHVKQTCLSQHIWKNLKRNHPHIPYTIVWDEVDRGAPYNPSTGVCRLCLLEKYHIMNNPDGASLNQRTEFFCHCYHKYPQLLQNFNFNPPNHKYHTKYNRYPFNY